MKIEYDKKKRAKTLEEIGLDFEDASTVLDGIHFTYLDKRKSNGEFRLITIGELVGRAVIIVHTPRKEKIRIISMREANERETRWCKKQLEEGR